VANAVKLKRKVEVFQRTEVNEDPLNEDSEKFSYKDEWKNYSIDSSMFQKSEEKIINDHIAFVSTTEIFYADEIIYGGYVLSKSQILKMNKYLNVKLNENQFNPLPQNLQQQINKLPWKPVVSIEESSIYFRQKKRRKHNWRHQGSISICSLRRIDHCRKIGEKHFLTIFNRN